VRGVTIRRCTFANVRYAIGAAGSGAIVEDIVVEDCEAEAGTVPREDRHPEPGDPPRHVPQLHRRARLADPPPER
jgi:hypothetical protein